VAGAPAATPSALNTTCSGDYSGKASQVTVPRGVICTLRAETQVTGDVLVMPGGSLIDQGADIEGSLIANNPTGIVVGGDSTSLIAREVQIQGMTGRIRSGDNYICNAAIGGNLSVRNSAATAGPLVIGDTPDCPEPVLVSRDLTVDGNYSHVDVSKDAVARNLVVQSNADGVTVSENSVLEDLTVQLNRGGTTVYKNEVGAYASCIDNKPATVGAENKARMEQGCPTG